MEKLKTLLEKVGGVIGGMSPENIVMMARAGSFIYNLSTPQSDIDYIIIYKDPTEVNVTVYVFARPIQSYVFMY